MKLFWTSSDGKIGVRLDRVEAYKTWPGHLFRGEPQPGYVEIWLSARDRFHVHETNGSADLLKALQDYAVSFQ